MTAERVDRSRSRGRFGGRSFHFAEPLCGGPRWCEGRDVHQIVGDDPEADPAVHAIFAMVATAVESVSAFEHTDAAFAADAPPLTPTEPALALVRVPRLGLLAAPRQYDPADAAVRRGLFIGRRAETAIAGRQIRCAAEDVLMPIQGGGPQRHIRWAFRVDVVRRDDLVFRFLNRDELAELGRLRNLPLANRLRVRFEEAQYFVADVRIPTQEARPGLVDDPLHERPQRTQLILGAFQPRLDLRVGGPHALAQPPHHRRGVTEHRARGRHQGAITLDHRVPSLWRSGFVPNDQDAPRHTPQPIPNPTGAIAQRGARPLQRPRQHAHAIPQQRAVGRVVHISFYDRGVDAKSATVRDPG